MDVTTLPPGHVANPAYAALFRAYTAAYGSIDAMREALGPPNKTLNATDAWLGPEARTWGGDLVNNQSTLRKASDQILWDIYDRLYATQRSLPVN
ncbi:hypothetical protein [Actinocorallia longicatena]